MCDITSCNKMLDYTNSLSINKPNFLNFEIKKYKKEIKMAKINNRKNEILDFIIKYQNEFGYPPTVREMCKELNISSTSTVSYYLDILENEGLIKKNANKNRALEIQTNNGCNLLKIFPSDSSNLTRIPIVGKITAGAPILAVEECEEFFMVSPNLFRGEDLFMLNVSGESMINAGIYDGDKIILHKQSTANNGEIVAALVDDNYATVKRFYKENGRYRLQPENDTMQPIYSDNVSILGKVVGLVRKF